MNKTSQYLEDLQKLDDWDAYLLENSGLPGPRSNLELAYAAASLASDEQVSRWLKNDAQAAPTNTPMEFLAICAAIALGHRLGKGDPQIEKRLSSLANDTRWRIRESVAMALQVFGDADMVQMTAIVRRLAGGSLLQQRAAAASICEPRLLKQREHALAALDVLNSITSAIPSITDRKSDDFQALKKGLGYCWSVAVAALPGEGKLLFSAWLDSPDRDIRWILRENLKKNRLIDPRSRMGFHLQAVSRQPTARRFGNLSFYGNAGYPASLMR